MFGVHRIEVHKLALTMTQVEEYKPPPNPAKMSDSRAEKYVAEHGVKSWEVDALNPGTLADIIRAAFEDVIDRPLMDKVVEREKNEKAKLTQVVAAIDWDAE